MGECIEIIEHFGGDVVKFLGDAVLVCFQADLEDDQTADDPLQGSRSRNAISLRQKSVLVRRAVECGLQLLARQSHYRVYLTAEERSKHRGSTNREIERRDRGSGSSRFFLFDGGSTSNNSRTSSDDRRASSIDSIPIPTLQQQNVNNPEEYSMAFSFWHCFPFFHKKNRVYALRHSLNTNHSDDDRNAIDLELHIAVSCGDITNVIVGDVGTNTHIETPLSPSKATNRKSHYSYASMEGSDATGSDQYLEYFGRLEYAVCGNTVEALEPALTLAKAGEMSITPEVYVYIQQQPLVASFERRRDFYIIKSTHNNHNQSPPPRKTSPLRHPMQKSSTAPNLSYLADRPALKQQANNLNIEPIIPRIRNTSYLRLSTDANPNYHKYLNRSALYRLQHSVDDNFPAQFRDVTIMFINLGNVNVANKDGLMMAQKAVKIAMKALVKYEGVLQQFAVDDKGATLLAVFGLPPQSHEREAIFAAKAAIDIRDKYSQFLPGFAIALSTGIIFNAVMPQSNPYRRDPGIAGDTIVLAVRMLKFSFARESIVCDYATKAQIGGQCEFEEYGENFVKGKVKPVPIYGIQNFTVAKTKRLSLKSLGKTSDFIGYKTEMSIAKRVVDEWDDIPNHHVLIISGPSGVGKSFFCHALHKTLSAHGVTCCWSSSTEVEKGSKYYLVKNLLLSLFEIIDSDSVPQRAKRRTSCLYNGLVPLTSGSCCSNNQNESIRSSQTSLPSPLYSKKKFQRLPSNSTMNRSSAATSSLQQQPEMSNEVMELISRCLKKCGEDEGFLPLFKVAFPTLSDVVENKHTVRLDGRGRDVLFTGVISRMVRHVSEHVGLVFVCDDVQWADSASMRVLQYIHEQCQRVMLLLATRPVKDYHVTFIKHFCNTGSPVEITLNGLSADEIGEIILQTFQAGVNRVSSEIVHVIQKRTGGNPLYVKNMAIILKDFNHVTVVQGELVPRSNRFDLEDLLGNFDYKRIIKMQFDRLDANFQEFLTVASCLDQHFTIYEVEAVIKSSNAIFQEHDPQKIRSIIQKYDVYHFLQPVTESSIDNSNETYSFAHITIPQSIYYMVSYETRILLHRLLARYYESQLTRENYSQLLGKVTRHFLETDWLDKQLYYLEALADLNMRSYLLPEATNNLERIVKLLDNNEELALKYGHLHRSDIYRRLGICLAMRTKLVEGEKYLFMALRCLGEPWPESHPDFLYRYWKNRFVQYQHRRWRVFHKTKKDLKRQIHLRVTEIMAQLSNIYFYTGKGRAFIYTCLVGLNACERLGDVGPNYTLFLARNSLLCWLNDKKEHSIFYITRALQYMDEKSDAGTLTIYAHLCFAAGKFSMARERLYQSIDAVRTYGVATDCQSFYRCVGLIVTMRIFEGTLDQSPDDLVLLKQMADTAHSNSDFEAEIWLGVYNIANALIMDRLRECEPFVALLEAHLKEAADYNRIAIHGTLLCYYARCRSYENARRHTRCLVAVLPALTVTPNIFPIFGLIFATMGMFCLIEDEEVDIVSMGDHKNYERFIRGITRINHAFQQVKFWEFTQPCLYLARALPYLSTGRTVEGFTVLRHGVYEMHFIQEIRFLRAYYWAILGKYAFMPSERIEWTNRAKADLEALEIPSHVYCNPDPGKYYSWGTPADLAE
ncbi:uncharacterized protein BYT42DRAFT_575048 [Radiomyces spectabilis]|uniref:uncharacterized protein n=1 Tax=Radiomyces spectabilis TaxID=64574 RepID=UPI00221F0DAE|nr:uncharacterized protein BYT42DRAFT_575048 [Radiomyces spectabilis]KAI8376559.1 hypothetical protein BYT42DRAFT_575048 [Radiomyces spectabilis]